MSRVTRRRIGAAPVFVWTSIPQDQAIDLHAGDRVAVVASVKASHSAADLGSFAAKRGLILTDFAEEGQRAGLGPDPRSPDYRYVAAIALAQKNVSLPWSAPWPLSMVDGSQLVSAWTAPPGPAQPAPEPPPPAPERGASLPSFLPLAFVGGVAGLLVANALRARGRRYVLAGAR